MSSLSPRSEEHAFAQLQREQLEELKRFFFLLLRKWYYIAAGAVLGLILAFTANKLLTPQYQVGMQVIKQSEGKGDLGLPAIPGMEELGKSSVNIEYEKSFFKSKPSLLAVIEKLGLGVSYYAQEGFGKQLLYGTENPLLLRTQSKAYPKGVSFQLDSPDGKTFTLTTSDDLWAAQVKGKQFSFGTPQQVSDWQFTLHYTLGKPGSYTLLVHDQEALVRSLKESINLSVLGGKGADGPVTVLAFDYKNPSPARSTDLMQALYEQAREQNIQEKNEKLYKTIAFIEQQLGQITDSLKQASTRMHQLKLQDKQVALGSTEVFARVLKLEEEKKQLQVAAKYHAYLKDYIRKKGEGQIISPATFGVDNGTLDAMLTRYIELKLQSQRDLGDYANKSPLYQMEKEEQKRALKSLEQGILGNIDNQAASLNFRIRELQSEMGTLMGGANSVLTREKAFEDFARLFKLNENLFTVLLEKKAEASISMASATSDYRLLEAPEVAPKPVAPKKPLNYLIGLLLGVLLPVGGLYVFNMLDDKIKTQEELERLSQLPVLGAVAMSNQPEAMVMAHAPKSAVAESIRGIRANLRYLVPNQAQGYCLMLTSSVSGEGKTFLSVNLAHALAMLGKRVVVVGCDLRRPRLHEVMGISNARGLSDYLSGGSELVDVLRPTPMEGVHVIVAGPVPPNPVELLSNQRMHGLMERLKEQFDVVLLDCAPVGMVSDAKALYSYADVILMVARQSFTSRELARQISSHFDAQEQKRLSLLLNAVEMTSRYGYGSYGKYGLYYEEEKREV